MLILYFCYVVRYGTACTTDQWGVWAHLFIPVNIFCSWWGCKSALYSPQQEKKDFYGLNVLEVSRRQPPGSGIWLKLRVCLFWCVFSSANRSDGPVSGRGSVRISVRCTWSCWWDVQPLLPKREVWTESGAWAFPLQSWRSSDGTGVLQGPAASLLPLSSLESQAGFMPLCCLLRLIWL